MEKLMPAYSLYINTKVNEYVEGNLDLDSLEVDFYQKK